ncbi:hypothetical protein F4803DRAFT_534993 [Xylaria telfairii]|nr:hypothetical protein F4803DRAFT_534993 [Xylaria telfairii]
MRFPNLISTAFLLDSVATATLAPKDPNKTSAVMVSRWTAICCTSGKISPSRVDQGEEVSL